MFGYVRPDTPYLYIKDQHLYRAMYCGVCKGIGQTCGQRARMGLSYDVTFLSVLLHNIAGQDVKIEKQHCLTHCIRNRQMAETDGLTRKLGVLNTLLVYYKHTDDIADGDRGRGKRLWFKKGFKRAKKADPILSKIVRDNLAAQSRVEKERTDSVDRAADATATMLAACSEYLLQEKATPHTYALFYAIGKWIYLIDALDDYDKDVKKGAYNPFYLAYGAKDLHALTTGKDGDEVAFIFDSLFLDIRERLAEIPFAFNTDLSDNILLRGLPATTKRIMQKAACGCDGCHKKEKKQDTK